MGFDEIAKICDIGTKIERIGEEIHDYNLTRDSILPYIEECEKLLADLRILAMQTAGEE